MRDLSIRSLILGALLWITAALLAVSTPTPAKASAPCPNTDCLGAHYCSFMPGNTCHLVEGQCTVTDC
jgi:hypothetical protein